MNSLRIRCQLYLYNIILSRKKEALLTSMQQLQEAVDYIDWKQGFYDDVLSGKTAYYSNLIPETTPDASESTAS